MLVNGYFNDLICFPLLYSFMDYLSSALLKEGRIFSVKLLLLLLVLVLLVPAEVLVLILGNDIPWDQQHF